MSGEEYHVPVLAVEVSELFVSGGGGVYVDGTLGGCGHFRAIAERAAALAAERSSGVGPAPVVMIGIDRDGEAIERARRSSFDGIGARVIIEQARFSEFDAVLGKHSIEKVRGLFVDLGVSSRQIDEPGRGFMYMKDAPLDMRMDRGGGVTAAEFLERCEEEELTDVLKNYGEVRNAPRLAGAIKAYMRGNKMETSADLKNCVAKEYGGRFDIKLLAKLFQALRIRVNGELAELRTFLDKSVTCLAEGGRVAVISYHSLEDRMVKDFFREAEAACVCDHSQPVCTCGKHIVLRRVNRKAIMASDEEIKRNSRSRSARLRVAERVFAPLLIRKRTL
ncbi:MAG: 16S rRNA (cytosine(1402)-N(4))-methyltransferase RsmH [Chitinispirillales bacterium]|jgi:16S rRNA (cytosine1402-N4)-methyltransferase|nr:16S rRNA (cytosine(1402)-N(4))-methyltransferase RsmH [Chitinispirillales bacterium]